MALHTGNDSQRCCRKVHGLAKAAPIGVDSLLMASGDNETTPDRTPTRGRDLAHGFDRASRPQHRPPPPAGMRPHPPGAREALDSPGFESERSALVKVLALLGVAVAVACVVLAVVVIRLGDRWDPALEPFVEFVEQERGLEFRRPVDLRRADIAAEITRDRELEDELSSGPDAPVTDPWIDAYALLGLIEPNPDVTFEDQFTDTLVENAGAFYEPWTETIVLPEGVDDAALSVTIVHELTHALQHQHGLLGAGEFDSADTATVRIALIEGDAERIAFAYFSSLTESEQNAYIDATGIDVEEVFSDPGNSFYEASFFASYEIGRPLVETIIATEGIDAFNELLRSKDVGTTERLTDPLSGDRQSAANADELIRLPAGADASVGDLGSITWFQALAPLVGTDAALSAIVGYDDDTFATYDDDGTTCARFLVLFDDEVEAAEFAAVVARLSAVGVAMDRTGVEVDICDPVGDPEDQRFGTILPLIVGGEVASLHVQNGESESTARCAALAQAQTIDARAPAGDFVGFDAIREQSADFLVACR